MSLDQKMDAQEIVWEVGMSARPEFYSGRGAISDDLTGEKLEKMHQLIEREHGADAAQHFVYMVADIPVLSATDFLLSLFRLEGHEWEWDKRFLGHEKGIYAGDVASAIFTIAEVVTKDPRQPRDDTRYIRNGFLKAHGVEVAQETRVSYSVDSACYWEEK